MSTIDNNIDDHVDAEITQYLSLDTPKSFFLFAGAGSGKTRSLVKALEVLCEREGHRLQVQGQRIGVITYTNAACDEIKHRLSFNPLVEVSTIHSFVWALVEGFNGDIKVWLRSNLTEELTELREAQRKGRAGTKAAIDRAKSIEAKEKRLRDLIDIRRFIYSPTGDNRTRDSLNHSEVIAIGADFLQSKPLMRQILVGKFPILLVDESQDTNRLLVDAFLGVQIERRANFALGLFGDAMQRIYADGKVDLANHLPDDWAKPAKRMNHRCPKRVVDLINKIRAPADGQAQQARSDKESGHVRLFVVPSGAQKTIAEARAMERMAAITNDMQWSGASSDVKTLILEHHMAARRMGFIEMFEALYRVESSRTSLLDGTLLPLRFFSKLILPLVKAKHAGDDFSVAAILRKSSRLLTKEAVLKSGPDQRAQLAKARAAVAALMSVWRPNPAEVSFLEVLRCIAQTELFELPEILDRIAKRTEVGQMLVDLVGSSLTPDEGGLDATTSAWEAFLKTPFAQIEAYDSYTGRTATFDTHQGVKGLEFPRVMVIIDDAEARGFMFSYDKLFGVKEKSATDLENEQQGKETGIDRTRRLFYVTCSRAKSSLALVAYSEDPERVRRTAVSEGWFVSDEIEILH